MNYFDANPIGRRAISRSLERSIGASRDWGKTIVDDAPVVAYTPYERVVVLAPRLEVAWHMTNLATDANLNRVGYGGP